MFYRVMLGNDVGSQAKALIGPVRRDNSDKNHYGNLKETCKTGSLHCPAASTISKGGFDNPPFLFAALT